MFQDIFDSAKNIRRAAHALSVLAEVSGLVFALIYIVFVALLMYIGFSNIILGAALIIVTGAYLIFGIVSLLILESRRPKKIIKLICRYTKYAMRLINMAFVIVTLITMPYGQQGQLLAVIGIIVLIVSFALSVMIDVAVFVIRRMVRSVIQGVKQEFSAFANHGNTPPPSSITVTPVEYGRLPRGSDKE